MPPHSPRSKAAQEKQRLLIPPAVLLCVALLVFFSSLRKPSPHQHRSAELALDEASLLVAEELAMDKASPGLDQSFAFAGADGEEEEPDVSAGLLAKEERQEEEDSGGVDGVQADPKHLVVAGLGDVLLLKSLVQESRRLGNFSHLWRPVQHLWLKHAHYTFANFEGTCGAVDKHGKVLSKPVAPGDYYDVFTNSVSGGGFNYHPSLASEAVRSGINVFTTANNHAFDRGVQGLTVTARTLIQAGAVQVGVVQQLADASKPFSQGWYRITKSNGWRVAWVGCTMLLCSTCRWELRISAEELRRRVLFCDSAPLLVHALSKRKDVDVVIVGAHWGTQFTDQYAQRTAEIAHQILDAGAAVIYGNHPHVMQGAEHYRTRDGRNTYVAYSIGSITSGLGSSAKAWKSRSSFILFVEFAKWGGTSEWGAAGARGHNASTAARGERRSTAEVVSVKYVPICEVRNAKQGFRTMLATAHAMGKCAREEAWTKLLLGDKDLSLPEQLPFVSRGPVEIVDDQGWRGLQPLGQGAAEDSPGEAEETRAVVGEIESWRLRGSRGASKSSSSSSEQQQQQQQQPQERAE